MACLESGLFHGKCSRNSILMLIDEERDCASPTPSWIILMSFTHIQVLLTWNYPKRTMPNAKKKAHLVDVHKYCHRLLQLVYAQDVH